MSSSRAVASRALLHPAALAAIALLVLNDHLFKHRFGGWWTGKLSDVAGLAVFPLLLAAAIELLGRPMGRRGVTAVAALTGTMFAAIKLWGPAGDLYRVGLAMAQWPFRALAAFAAGDAAPPIGHVQLTADPTDLLALPMLALSIWLVARLERREFSAPEPEACEGSWNGRSPQAR